MKKYQITVNGNTYEVEVEQIGGSDEVKVADVAPIPKAAPAPVPAAAPAPEPAAAKIEGGVEVSAPMSGKILSLSVSEGDQVKEGQLLLVFEAMKMENELFAPNAGTIARIHVAVGAVVDADAPVITIV